MSVPDNSVPADGFDAQSLVEVYTVTDPVQAELIRASLQNEGIACWIEGESQAGLAGVLTISLRTRALDADRARRIIEACGHSE